MIGGIKIRRKVIQHSPTSLVITLPKKWVEKKYIRKGEELELIERGDELVILKENVIKAPKEIDIDISNLDKTTTLHVIRNLYRAGYDKITLRFDKDEIYHPKEENAYSVSQLTHTELQRLIGYEVTRERKNSCIIENISEGVTEGLPTIVRRIYLLIIDIAETLFESAQKNDQTALRGIQQKHETIIRFLNYCLRSATKTESEPAMSYNEFYLLATMDRVVRTFRSISKRLISLNRKQPQEVIDSLRLTVESIRLIHKYMYTKKSIIVNEMNKIRYEIEDLIENKPKNLDNRMDHILFHCRLIHHLFLDICDVRGT